MTRPQLDTDADVEDRIYRYVERRGSAPREEVRKAVRVVENPGAKPARSGTAPAARLSVSEFDRRVDGLLDDGPLAERDGRLYVAPDAEAETRDAGEFAYVIRPADEADRAAVADLIRSVAREGALVVDERVADAIERDGALIRRNERESRTFFVAQLRDESDDELVSGETIGWVHVHGVELPARSHTAALTVGVDEAYRERGVGGALLERGMAWADEEGYIKLYQSLPATNRQALDLLADHGWEREATRADHYRVDGELVDEVQLAKRLDGES